MGSSLFEESRYYAIEAPEYQASPPQTAHACRF